MELVLVHTCARLFRPGAFYLFNLEYDLPMAKTSKTTASHSTLTKPSQEIVDIASKLPAVTKISISIIKPVGGGRRSLKFLPIIGGIKAVVQGNGAVQELFIYTNDPEEVQKKLKEGFVV